MKFKDKNFFGCSDFEALLSEYLERTLDADTHKLMAEHSLVCPICHSLLDDVRILLEACRELPTPKISLTKLEAKVLSATAPGTSMSCEEFEEYLTDYLDGFLPAPLFHRWERHAAFCERCSDLPGMVVRSIALCYTYKSEELPVPEGLQEKLMQIFDLGNLEIGMEKKSKRFFDFDLTSFLKKVYKTLFPQLAPVAMMLIFAIFILSQITEGTLGTFYLKSFELAEKAYKKSAKIIIHGSAEEREKMERGENEP